MTVNPKDRPPFGWRGLYEPARLQRALALMQRIPALSDDYRPWRKFRHLAHTRGFNSEDAWAAIKLSRLSSKRGLALEQANGDSFSVTLAPSIIESLHQIDRATGGGGPAAVESDRGSLFDESHRIRWRIRSLMDEAVESSLLEGAATTRKHAVEMLRADRAPRTKGERMVVNNYVAMQDIKKRLDQPLTPEMLIDLQATLTRDTLEDPGEVGRFRRSDETVRVEDARTGDVVYVPPPATQLPNRITRLCDFANFEHVQKNFLHPIVKAAILHFMIGYEHPFVDGNGRTARAVFYWFALRSGYRIFEYMPISERIRQGFARYPQAYIDTELDDGDLTYFVLYQLNIIELALDDLAEHLRQEEAKLKRSGELLKLSRDLNLRQRLILEHGLRHPTTQYTVKSHMNSNGVTPATARADLESLVRRRLMVTTRCGKQVIYHVAPGLRERLDRKNT